MPLSRLDLRLQRPVRDVPYLGKERLPNGVKSYPVARGRRPDLRLSRRSGAGARAAQPAALGAFAAQGLQDPAAEPRSGLPLHLHAREPVRHEPPVHAPQADGLDHGRTASDATTARTGRRSNTASAAPRGKSSVGEHVIVDLMRKRGEAEEGISPITCASAPTTRHRV